LNRTTVTSALFSVPERAYGQNPKPIVDISAICAFFALKPLDSRICAQ